MAGGDTGEVLPGRALPFGSQFEEPNDERLAADGQPVFQGPVADLLDPHRRLPGEFP